MCRNHSHIVIAGIEESLVTYETAAKVVMDQELTIEHRNGCKLILGVGCELLIPFSVLEDLPVRVQLVTGEQYAFTPALMVNLLHGMGILPLKLT